VTLHSKHTARYPQRVRHGSSKMVKGRLAYFSPECSAIIPLLTEYFPHVEPFGYDNSPNEGTVKFSAKLGKFPHFPQNRGTRWRVQSRDVKITPYPQLFITYPRSVRLLFLIYGVTKIKKIKKWVTEIKLKSVDIVRGLTIVVSRYGEVTWPNRRSLPVI